MMQLVFVVSLALAAPGDDGSPFSTVAFVAPDAQSSVEGPFGVLFVPRYRDAATAQARRDEELRLLDGALTRLDRRDRAALQGALDRRLVAVRHWRGVFEDRLRDALPAEARLEVLRQRDLLVMEEATLEAQLAMLGVAPAASGTPAAAPLPPEPPTPPLPPLPPSGRAQDRVVFGGDVEVAEGERVNDAVSIGGDVVVRGIVEGDAVAFGGTVRVPATGRVLGEATALGGDVEADDQADVAVRTAIGPAIGARVHDGVRLGPWARFAAWFVPALAFASAGVLAVGVAPERVGRVADMVEERPLTAIGTGLLGAVAILFAALLFTITLIGIPVALVLLGALAAAWLIGLVGLCTALGERLPAPLHDAPRWTRFLVGAAVVAVLAAVPVLGPFVVTATGLAGVGAALATRFGR